MIKAFELFNKEPKFFLDLFVMHLRISLIASTFAGILGLLIGILISKNKKLATVVISIVNTLYTIPSIALLGVLISYTGIGNTTAIIALTIYGLLPMVRNTYTGISSIDKNIIEAAHAMGSTEFQLLFKIKLPLALPFIMSGIRNMVTMTVALGGIASFVGAGGLGVAIYRGITTNNSSMILVGSLLVAVLAISLDLILGFIGKILIRCKKISIYAKIATFLLVLVLIGTLFIAQLSMSKNRIRIATKPVTENYILGEITALLIEENTDIDVNITHGVGGGTSNIHPAMIKGDFDIYTEYTGTAWSVVLKQKEAYNESKFDIIKQRYKDEFDMSWVGMFGFNNSYGIGVRTDLAKEYNLKNISDIAKVSNKFSFGANHEFYEVPQGYKFMDKAYGFNFKSKVDMANGLKYQAILDKKVDAIVSFTTDGELSNPDITLLRDDKMIYPTYIAGNVVRNDVLKKYPELIEVFKKMDGLLNEEQMSILNNEVVAKGKNPRDVARKFLEDRKLLEVKNDNNN